MILIRIALAGTLLLGASCALQDERELDTDEMVDHTGLTEPMSYSSDELMPPIRSDPEADVHQAELDEPLTEEAFDDEAFDEASLNPPNKVECTYCAPGGGCFSATHPHEFMARNKARRACEKVNDFCFFAGCKKA